MPGRRRNTGWARVAFGEMAANMTERVDRPAESGVDRYVGLEHLDPDSLRIQRWGVPSDVVGTKLRFRKGDIVFGRRRAYQRKLAVAHFDGICSAHALVLRALPGVVLPEFLPFFMQSEGFMERARRISVGSLSPTINWKTLEQEEFVLPPPPEQRRLATALQSLESVSESIRRVQQSIRNVERSLVSRCLEQQGASLTRVKALLREPPRNGVSPSAGAQGIQLNSVSVGAVANGLFSPDDHLKPVNIEPRLAERFFVQREDVFVVRGNGNRRRCGKAGISERSHPDLIYPDLLIRLRFDPSQILPDFAVAQWNLPMVHRRLSTRAKSTNGIWKVNGADIRAHQLSAPPMTAQQELCIRLMSLRQQERSARERSASIRAMRHAVLG